MSRIGQGTGVVLAGTGKPPPIITSITPATGVNQGDTVTITGNHFTSHGAASTTLTVNGGSVTPTVESNTSITFPAPAYIASPFALVLTNSNGTWTEPDAYDYQVPLAPAIATISPDWGYSDGSFATFSVTGSHFLDPGHGTLHLLLGPLNLTLTVDTDSTAHFTDIYGDFGFGPTDEVLQFDVQLSDDLGVSNILTDGFQAERVPEVLSLTPKSGPVGGGTTVVIQCHGLESTHVFGNLTTVRFNGSNGSFSVASQNITITGPEQITVVTPAADLGGGWESFQNASGYVAIIGGDGDFGESYSPSIEDTGFEFVSATEPWINRIDCVAPSSGSGAVPFALAINGKNFLATGHGATTIKLISESSFVEYTCTGLALTSDTQIDCLTPALTPAGTYVPKVINSLGTYYVDPSADGGTTPYDTNEQLTLT